MKIIITLKDMSESGGGERVCANLANAFIEYGYNVEIISFFKRHKTPSYTLSQHAKLIYLSRLSPQSKNIFVKLFCKSVYRLYLSYKTHRLIVDSKKDLDKSLNGELGEAHNSLMLLANDGWFVPYQKAMGVHYVRLWHLSAPKKTGRYNKPRLFHTLVILSRTQKHIWESYHKNVRVIPNFLPFLPQKSTDSKQKVVLSVGRMDRGDQKGFLRLIDIWEMVQDSIKKGYPHLNEWQLHIVGDGVLKQEIESKIKDKNLQDSILLKPFTKDIESAYLNASIYVMTSFFEGFGMVLVEAGSYALPCIAFDVATGPSDIIENNKSGCLIQDNDLHTYAERLIELMDSQAQRARMGKEAKRIVKKKFSKEAIMPLWETVLKETRF